MFGELLLVESGKFNRIQLTVAAQGNLLKVVPPLHVFTPEATLESSDSDSSAAPYLRATSSGDMAPSGPGALLDLAEARSPASVPSRPVTGRIWRNTRQSPARMPVPSTRPSVPWPDQTYRIGLETRIRVGVQSIA
jgi:hypothetical protein